MCCGCVPAAQCDTSIFGGSQGGSATGFVLGQPAFAIAQNNATGFFWGRIDVDPAQAGPNWADPASGIQFSTVTAGAQGTGMLSCSVRLRVLLFWVRRSGLACVNDGGALGSNQRQVARPSQVHTFQLTPSCSCVFAVCADPTAAANFCSSWTTNCGTSIDESDLAVDGTSFTETFSYCGPAESGDFGLGDVGWYTRNVTTYSDAECNVGALTFAESGTFQSGGLDGNEDEAKSFQRLAAQVQVTPIDADTVQRLSLACACAVDSKSDPWVANQTRTLTQCPQDTCSSQGWYFNATIGETAYGTIRRLTDGTHPDTLQMSLPDNTQAVGIRLPVTFLGGKAFEITDDTCAFDNPTYDYCGMWSRTCTAESFTFDTTEVLSLTGEGESDGQAVYYKEFFSPGQACDQTISQMTVEAVGFWSQFPVNGVQGLLINYHQVEIQTATPDMLNNPSTGCPCGGTWVANQKRVLKTCAAGTCPGQAIFGGGILGQPGYGKVVRVGTMIQMSKLQNTVADGISGAQLGMTDFPLTLNQECSKEVVVDRICGVYNQPCKPDGEYGTAVTSYTSDFYYETMDDRHVYWVNRSDYNPGTGCDVTPILKIQQSGALVILSDKTAVTDAKAVQLTPSYLSIQPLADMVTTNLNKDCPCSSKANPWVTGQARILTEACPAGTCSDYSWLRQPILGNGAPVFGSMRRMSNSLRMTQFRESKADGFAMLLDAFDFPYVLGDEDACKYSPPTPGGQSGGSMGGGSVFLILFMVLVLVYVGGGMIMNYMKTQTPTIPHIEFWRTVPGHVVDGINFAVCGLCGMRKGGMKYAEFGGNKDNGYGAL